jgi:hypothetical protein
LALLHRVRVIAISDLVPETSYADWIISYLSRIPPHKFGHDCFIPHPQTINLHTSYHSKLYDLGHCERRYINSKKMNRENEEMQAGIVNFKIN